MAQFIKIILFWMVLLVVGMILLDLGYSTVYLNINAKRNPVQIAIFTHNEIFDYIVMGSSRGNYHVNVPMINRQHNVQGFNFSYPGAQTDEMLLLLKILLSNGNQIGKIFMQIDNHDNFFDSTSPDSLAMQFFLPFLYNKQIWSHYYQYPRFRPYLFIPFYRYVMNRPNIGEREVLMTLIRRPGEHRLGFTPIKVQSINKPDVPGAYPPPQKNNNSNITELLEICERHKIEVNFFTSPIYLFDNRVNKAFHKTFGKQYSDFSTQLQCDSCYRDAFHLNYRGADLFTMLFMKKYFEE